MAYSEILESLWASLAARLPSDQATEIVAEVYSDLSSAIHRPNLAHVHREVSNCRRCEGVEHYDCKTSMWADQDVKALVVLERPRIGQEASQLLSETLAQNGFDKTNVALTYLNRCYMRDGSYTQEHRDNCFGYLLDEINSLRPRLVIACGKVVAEKLLGYVDGLSKIRGEIVWACATAILVTYSPLYVASQPDPKGVMQNFSSDLELAANYALNGAAT